MTVVVDQDDFIALWTPKGTVWKGSTMPPTRARLEERRDRILSSMDLCDWVLHDRTFDLSLLWFLEPEAGYAVTRSWTGTGLGSWYVNLQEPFRRTPLGLLTMDLLLDAVIPPGGDLIWKDEDELDGAVERGLIEAGKARWLRQEALRAAARIRDHHGAFSRPWDDWRPDPSWEVPALPEDWQRL